MGKINQKIKGTSEATPPWPLHRKQILPTASNTPVLLHDALPISHNLQASIIPPLSLPIKKSSKLPRVEDQIEPPPRVDPDEESKDRDQKLPTQIHKTPPSAAIPF